MKWASALSTSHNFEKAVRECAAEIKKRLEGASPDLAVVFISPHFSRNFHNAPEAISMALKPAHLIGCSAGGVIGGGIEVENAPALSITAARLPGVRIHTFHQSRSSMPKLDTTPRIWEEWIGVGKEPTPHFILLADPLTTQADHLISGLDYAYPASVKIGGLASGAGDDGHNALFVDQKVHQEGVCGLSFSGKIQVDTLVAQGCRPIGEPLQVTRCERNFLMEVNGIPVFDYIRDLYDALPPRDRGLLQHALFVGIVMDPLKIDYGPGDFLIRNLIGIDPAKEGLSIGAPLREGQTLQFHLRDSRTSSEDLSALLSRYTGEGHPERLKGALLFSCLGRGKHLYGKPNHDTGSFRQALGDIPVGGFFCNGEIGPVGETTFLHGYTSSFGLFSDPRP